MVTKMAFSNVLKEKVRLLHIAGMPYADIRERLDLKPDDPSDRSMIRWGLAKKPFANLEVNDVIALAEANTLDEEHCWPDWTVDDLADLPGFRADLWEVNIGLVHAAERQKNVYVPWFFRNLVELARRREMPDGSLPWSVAIAGLPVLAEWLDCPSCNDLVGLIEKHQPWIGKSERTAYQRDAKSVGESVNQCVLQAHGQMAMEDYAQEKVSRSTKAIAELGKRIPMFDRKPLRLRSDHTGKLILDVLLAPREN